jgi:hypothetical protein
MAKAEPQISEEDIRRRAYELSERDGSGNEEENWLRAERELREEAAAPKRKPRVRKPAAEKS